MPERVEDIGFTWVGWLYPSHWNPPSDPTNIKVYLCAGCHSLTVEAALVKHRKMCRL